MHLEDSIHVPFFLLLFLVLASEKMNPRFINFPTNSNPISTFQHHFKLNLNYVKSRIPHRAFTSASNNLNYVYEQARSNAHSYDHDNNYSHSSYTIPRRLQDILSPIHPKVKEQPSLKTVPKNLQWPPYAKTGIVPQSPNYVSTHSKEDIDQIRKSARLARDILDLACNRAKPGMTTNELDEIVHKAIIENGAYPSPLNYGGFPKSLCSSINEVICHGIPDDRRMREGDLASFDVSCYLNGYHGDNCGSIIVGDCDREMRFSNKLEELLFISGRRLIQATQEALDAAIATCHDGSCLSECGEAISLVAEAYGYSSVEKYRGHGIGRDFHCPPFVKHYRNDDYFKLGEGMVFTIEPMLTEGEQDCLEWKSDGWTVVTRDGGRSAQFEHMVAITNDGADILTLPTLKEGSCT